MGLALTTTTRKTIAVRITAEKRLADDSRSTLKSLTMVEMEEAGVEDRLTEVMELLEMLQHRRSGGYCVIPCSTSNSVWVAEFRIPGHCTYDLTLQSHLLFQKIRCFSFQSRYEFPSG
jgi:hypothetical protein